MPTSLGFSLAIPDVTGLTNLAKMILLKNDLIACLQIESMLQQHQLADKKPMALGAYD